MFSNDIDKQQFIQNVNAIKESQIIIKLNIDNLIIKQISEFATIAMKKYLYYHHILRVR